MKSQKMRAFYISSFIVFVYQLLNVVFMGGIESVFIANTWAIVTLGMAAITGKVMDDWQRGLNYKPEMEKVNEG
jgi:hypothetical protein